MYRASKYNVFIKRSASVIVYNTLWDTFLIMNEVDANRLKGGENSQNSYNEKLYQAFVDKKMLIDAETDEMAILQETFRKTTDDPTYFEIIISPTLACNFRCWYCYESHDDTSHISEDELQNIISLMRNIISERPQLKKFVVKFFGGEPLMCYKQVVQPIAEQLRLLVAGTNIEAVMGMTTNGYYLSHERINFLKKHGLKTLQITLDGNKERHNAVRFSKTETDSYSKIVKNIRLAVESGINVNLRLNVSEDTHLDIRQLLNDFSGLDDEARKCLIISVHKVWQANDAVHDNIDELLTEIRSLGFVCNSYFSIPSSIWSTCYADKVNHLTINPKGTIFKCTARDFDSCMKCAILPICVGGCSQRLLECEDKSLCPQGMQDEDRDKYAYRVLSEKIERLGA